MQKTKDRDAYVQAYRAAHGQLKSAADLIAKHPGWPEEHSAFHHGE